ncbi:MAG: UDP-N-acetylmuramoyl-tripeptide--D-alanyl-D-alanine ligase [Candidatus Methylopumilus sp.]
MQITLNQIKKIVGGKFQGDAALLKKRIKRISINSHDIQKGDLFIGIKGEKFDGDMFASEALKKGAVAVIVSSKQAALKNKIQVKTGREALGKIAQYWKAQSKIPLVAITGSNGKTTTKEMVASIVSTHLKSKNKLLVSQGNYNNDIGLPLSLLNIEKTQKCAVVEMGMNHKGEISYLSKIARPDVAVITNIAEAHIEFFGSKKGIAKAKSEIFEGLKKGGIAIINRDDDFYSLMKNAAQTKNIISFGLDKNADVYLYKTLKDISHIRTPKGQIDISLKLQGEHNLKNALAAIASSIALKIPLKTIKKGIEAIKPVQGRLEVKKGLNGAMLIDDTYNANPESMKAAIDVLSNQEGHKILVVGDMGELGKKAAQYHASIGTYINKKKISDVVGTGPLTKHTINKCSGDAKWFSNKKDLIKYVKSKIKKDSSVLVKGSRFMKMEEVVKGLT